MSVGCACKCVFVKYLKYTKKNEIIMFASRHIYEQINKEKLWHSWMVFFSHTDDMMVNRQYNQRLELIKTIDCIAENIYQDTCIEIQY